jgi:AbrB family looped-hinge helix DNA binding protein
MANIVGERYQITIDKAVRDELGIQPGDRAIERVEGGRLVIDFMPRPHNRSLYGIFHRPGMEPITDWEAFFDKVWEARGAEISEVLAADSARHRAAEDQGDR